MPQEEELYKVHEIYHFRLICSQEEPLEFESSAVSRRRSVEIFSEHLERDKLTNLTHGLLA
jgi:type IV secretory pathway VirD2 relaxase